LQELIWIKPVAKMRRPRRDARRIADAMVLSAVANAAVIRAEARQAALIQVK
jgi:hypothetical protein